VKLLVDNNLAPRLGRGLGTLFDGMHEVVHIKDQFGTGSLPDEVWIEAIGKEGGWCVLSADRRIATKKPSRELFLRSNLIGFFLMPAVTRLPLTALTARILTIWPVLVTTAGAMDRGCFEVGIKNSRLRPIA
jgi:hypothetical protein